MTPQPACATLAGLIALAAGPLLAEERAGRAIRVQQEAFQATSPIGFPIETDDDIFRQARIYTKQYGSIEITLLDGTALTVAPNASLVIDDYVFAGEGESGAMALSLGRGAMRLISGRMPKEGVAITTPSATIGVRGTTIWASVEGPDRTELWVTEGVGLITPTNGQTYEIAAPAHVICSAESCDEGGDPPVPLIFPLGGQANDGAEGGDNGGESGNP
ncbi:MAG: FecR domain-containing protein [Pikeienuella sp.]